MSKSAGRSDRKLLIRANADGQHLLHLRLDRDVGQRGFADLRTTVVRCDHSQMRRWFMLPLLALSACSAHAALNNQSPIAAMEVLTSTNDDRADLIALLRQAAPKQGFHVDDGSKQWRDFAAQVSGLPPPARKTLYAGVWSGKDDDDLIAMADDGGHNGRSWIIVYTGKHEAAARHFWVDLKAQLVRRWPAARSIPILPSGALPLSEDLQRTHEGYRISRSAAAKYGLAPSSLLITDGG